MSIAVYDTFCGSLNSGDAIIMDAVYEQLNSIFLHEPKIGYPTHSPLSLQAIKGIKKSRLLFVGGTNLLKSKVKVRAKHNQWGVGLVDSLLLRNRAILLGCGWNKYKNKENFTARLFYKLILSSDFLHSVRDTYTEKKLNTCGVYNVINTGCPTLWKLTYEHCRTIPKSKGDNVITTLTDYRRDVEADTLMLDFLFANYKKVFFWPQGIDDRAYAYSLLDASKRDRLVLIGTSLSEYDRVLAEICRADFVGTRLHAGIRALQKSRRAIIIAVDNRATEMSKDFGLEILERDRIEMLPARIVSSFDTEIHLPLERIEKWKSQFLQTQSWQEGGRDNKGTANV